MDKGNQSYSSCKPTFGELWLHHFSLNMELVAEKSAKVAYSLKQNPLLKLDSLVVDIPAEPEIIDIVVNFCRGYEPSLSSGNVIPLTCLAFYLEMTESHCNNNLIKKCLSFLEQRVLTNWNETIKALRFAGSVLPQAEKLGLIDACFQSLVEKALVNPSLVGDPIENRTVHIDSDDEDGDYDEEVGYRPNVKRRLFWKSEDLTTLSLNLYCLIMQRMNQYQIPPEYLAGSLCLYAEKYVFCDKIEEENISMYKRNIRRDVLEAIERLLPDIKGLIPSKILFKMLKYSISLESSNECRHGIEQRIGKQLHLATVEDLLIPSQGYTKETQYDIDCVRRILKHFYENYSTPDSSGFVPVAQLIEDFLIQVATDIDLRADVFVSVAEMSVAVSLGLQKNYDGIYRAVDIYFDKHRYLTEDERNEVCRVLDCTKMSAEACQHAITNERLPLRCVVQVLFATHLQMRETIACKVEAFHGKLIGEEKERESGLNEEEVRADMEKMSLKVMELEEKCCVMRKEIESKRKNPKMKKDKKEKCSMWKEMKRKFGCMSTNSINDPSCHVKKKKKY